MGLQEVGDVTLIRHAYVLPDRQGEGIGTRLMDHLRAAVDGPLLVGTWAAADPPAEADQPPVAQGAVRRANSPSPRSQ